MYARLSSGRGRCVQLSHTPPMPTSVAPWIVPEIVAHHDGLPRQAAAFGERQPEDGRAGLVHPGFLARNQIGDPVGKAEVFQLFHLNIRQHVRADRGLDARRLLSKSSGAVRPGEISILEIPHQ